MTCEEPVSCNRKQNMEREPEPLECCSRWEPSSGRSVVSKLQREPVKLKSTGIMNGANDSFQPLWILSHWKEIKQGLVLVSDFLPQQGRDCQEFSPKGGSRADRQCKDTARTWMPRPTDLPEQLGLWVKDPRGKSFPVWHLLFIRLFQNASSGKWLG